MCKFSKKVKNLIVWGVILIIGLSLFGCGKKADTSAQKSLTKIEKIKQSGKLVLGTCADYPPYEFHKKTNGKDEIIGFDIEIAKAIAAELGVKLEIVDMKFDGLLPALKTGNVDLIIAGMNVTDERKKQVDFSKTYYSAKQSVVVRQADKEKYKSLEDLKGKKIGVQMGTTQEQLAKEQIPNAQLVSLGKITDLILQIKNNKTDAVVIVDQVANSYVNKNPDLAIADAKFKGADDSAAIAVNKGNEDFITVINKVIDKLNSEKKIDSWIVQYNEIAQN